MKRKNKNYPAELQVPYGYEFDELYDTEAPDELGEPIMEEEVTVHFGRKNEK